MAFLQADSGQFSIGPGTQNILWSDSKVFAQHSENGGNALMYAMGERGLQILSGNSFESPIQLLDELLPEIWSFGKKITSNPDLRKTFALNALVALDNAAWLLYAQDQGIQNFDELIPENFKAGLSARHSKVVCIPALGYGSSMEEIKSLVDQGFFILKIKIGAPGSQEDMLEKDKEFLKNIHKNIGHRETPYSSHGKLPYYFDANGRYEKKETLLRFLDYAEKIGALNQIAVIEEPFGERNQENVKELAERGPRIAADESAHTDEEALRRIEQGYNSIAVKAVAKTLSMTLKIAKVAFEHNIPCFCADLTVNPILLEWNKAVAARLPAFPEMPGLGLQECNGWQNYKNWGKMMDYLPNKYASWINPSKGVFQTGPEFYSKSGDIFKLSSHYQGLFKK
ncbi:MAG: mandelate racemase/muconate lactonizing enzyme family protein [Bacteroidota bacterium]